MASLPYPSPGATPSPAETLRRAAALMRERANNVLSIGPGWLRVETARRVGNDIDAEHIASWHPAVALALADWLDSVAPHVEEGWPEHCALAVARAYLGGAA